MFPYQHFILGTIFIGFLFFIYPSISPIGLGIILSSTVLIDVDHYIYYAYKKRDLNFFRIRRWLTENLKRAFLLSREERNKLDTGIMFLHGFEILLLLLIFGFLISYYFFFIFIGFGFHLILDVLFNLTIIDRVIKISLIKDLIESKY